MCRYLRPSPRRPCRPFLMHCCSPGQGCTANMCAAAWRPGMGTHNGLLGQTLRKYIGVEQFSGVLCHWGAIYALGPIYVVGGPSGQRTSSPPVGAQCSSPSTTKYARCAATRWRGGGPVHPLVEQRPVNARCGAAAAATYGPLEWAPALPCAFVQRLSSKQTRWLGRHTCSSLGCA